MKDSTDFREEDDRDSIGEEWSSEKGQYSKKKSTSTVTRVAIGVAVLIVIILLISLLG